MESIDKLITSLGEPTAGNEYILKPDEFCRWWLTHRHVGSGEPFDQILNDYFVETFTPAEVRSIIEQVLKDAAGRATTYMKKAHGFSQIMVLPSSITSTPFEKYLKK